MQLLRQSVHAERRLLCGPAAASRPRACPSTDFTVERGRGHPHPQRSDARGRRRHMGTVAGVMIGRRAPGCCSSGTLDPEASTTRARTGPTQGRPSRSATAPVRRRATGSTDHCHGPTRGLQPHPDPPPGTAPLAVEVGPAFVLCAAVTPLVSSRLTGGPAARGRSSSSRPARGHRGGRHRSSAGRAGPDWPAGSLFLLPTSPSAASTGRAVAVWRSTVPRVPPARPAPHSCDTQSKRCGVSCAVAAAYHPPGACHGVAAECPRGVGPDPRSGPHVVQPGPGRGPEVLRQRQCLGTVVAARDHEPSASTSVAGPTRLAIASNVRATCSTWA